MNQEEVERGRQLVVRDSTPRPWEPKTGAVVSEWPPADRRLSMNAKDVIHYGGYLVAESIGLADAGLVVWLANHAEELLDCVEIVGLLEGLGVIKMEAGGEEGEVSMLTADDYEQSGRKALIRDLQAKVERKLAWAPGGLPADITEAQT